MNMSICNFILLKQSRLFTGLGENELKSIIDAAFPLYLREGQLIVQEGDTPSAIHFIQDGRIKVFKDSPIGKEFIIDLRRKGETVNEVAVLEGLPCFASAQAIEETLVVAIRKDDFLNLANKNPIIVINAARIMGERIRNLYDKIFSLVVDTTDRRLIKILLLLSSKYGPTLSLNRKEIAEMVGTTSETSTRILTRLKKLDALYLDNGKIIIRDRNKLELLSNYLSA